MAREMRRTCVDPCRPSSRSLSLTVSASSLYALIVADRSRKTKRPRDSNVRALDTVLRATGEVQMDAQIEHQAPDPTPEERHEAAVALGRLGGKRGGKARAAKMTAEERAESARKAARARWDKAKEIKSS